MHIVYDIYKIMDSMDLDRQSVNERLKVESEKPYGRQKQLKVLAPPANVSSNQTMNKNSQAAPPKNPQNRNQDACEVCREYLNHLISHPCILSLVQSQNFTEESYKKLSIKLLYIESLLFAYSKAYEIQKREIEELKSTSELILSGRNELSIQRNNQKGYGTASIGKNNQSSCQNKVQDEINKLKEIIRINMKIIFEKDMIIDKMKEDFLSFNMNFFEKEIMKPGEYEKLSSVLSSFSGMTSDAMYFRSALEDLIKSPKIYD